MDDDPHAELRHLLRNQLTVIRGWSQLVVREANKPVSDIARLSRYAANMDASITALDEWVLQRFGPNGTEIGSDHDRA